MINHTDGTMDEDGKANSIVDSASANNTTYATSENRRVVDGSAGADPMRMLAELRDLADLSPSEIGRLLGVYSRRVLEWIDGAPVSDYHINHIARIVRIMSAELNGSTSADRRRELFDSSDGMSLFHRLVGMVPETQIIQGDALSARDQLSIP